MKVQNEIIVVTGGGNGIGRELVLNLLARGSAVAAKEQNRVVMLPPLAKSSHREITGDHPSGGYREGKCGYRLGPSAWESLGLSG
jgi:NAD(P)-dependent dehydrogenase (short-subunit alcohol dehydrogenase family)